MATAYSDPVSDISYTWNDASGTNASRIDDGIRQPTTTGFDAFSCVNNKNDDNEEIEFLMSDPLSAGDLVTAITVWFYASCSISSTLQGRHKANGAYSSYQNISTASGTSWRSITWGSLSYTKGSTWEPFSCTVKIGSVGTAEEFQIRGMYAEITYTPAGGGVSHIRGAGHLLGILWEDDEEF